MGAGRLDTAEYEPTWTTPADFLPPRHGGFEPPAETPIAPDCNVPGAVESLRTAEALITGDRQAAYGHPQENFHAAAVHMSAILWRLGVVPFGTMVPDRAVPLIQAAWKLDREAFQPKSDNRTDAAAYAVLSGEVGGVPI